MTDYEIALTVLYAARDNARMEYNGHFAAYRETLLPGALADAHREENLLDALDRIIADILQRVEQMDEEIGGEDRHLDDRYSDAEADSYVLASAGWGTDEDYGYFGGGYDDF